MIEACGQVYTEVEIILYRHTGRQRHTGEKTREMGGIREGWRER